MTEEMLQRLLLLGIVQAEIEGMKAANLPPPHDQYGDEDFIAKADIIRSIMNCPDTTLYSLEV